MFPIPVGNSEGVGIGVGVSVTDSESVAIILVTSGWLVRIAETTKTTTIFLSGQVIGTRARNWREFQY